MGRVIRCRVVAAILSLLLAALPAALGVAVLAGPVLADSEGTAAGGAAPVPLRVQRVVLVERSPAVLLVDEPHQRYLLVFVDLFMANAIRMGMDGIRLERPLTHDLMGTLLDRLGARLSRVTITELRHNTYYARIVLQINGAEVSLDARPSDALALAVRQGTPVFGAAGLLKSLREPPEAPDPGPEDGPERRGPDTPAPEGPHPIPDGRRQSV